MSCAAGPDINENGLVFALDVGNKKTFANSVINSTSWDLGSGSASGYGQNGNTNENERVTGTDPFGKSAIVWETRASGDGGADGGWNSDWYNIDNTKLYRFSVWVKRTSTSSGGTFYLGLYGNASGVRRTDTSAYEGNPYWECSGTSKFDKDVWYLVVGHCYPYNTTYTGQHPETGIYTIAGGATKVLTINACNIGTDVKWAGSDVTQTVHRCYHYYCGDSTTRLQLFDPRIDAIDGTEPSISALLSGFTANRLTDLVGTNNGTFKNAPTYSSANGGSLVFDGTDDYVNLGSFFNYQTFTIELWVNPGTTQTTYADIFDNNHTGGQNFVLQQNADNLNNYSFAVIDGSGDISATGTIILTANTWTHLAFTFSPSTRVIAYVNGAFHSQGNLAGGRTINYVSPNLSLGRWSYGNSRFWKGNISNFKTYNRILTASEIQQNFNANRSRFGI